MAILSICCKQKETIKNSSIQTIVDVKRDTFRLLKKEHFDIREWDTLSIESVKFNNKKLFFSIEGLKLKQIDSIRYDFWACGSPFEWMDEEKGNDSISDIFIKGTRYSTNGDKVLLVSSMIKNNQLRLINDTINEFSTIDDFERIFPLSYNKLIEAKQLNPENYLEYDYMEIPFFEEQPADHWIFYFNKKGIIVRFELYWWLC